MATTGSFKAICPKCQRERRQDAYSRKALARLLRTGGEIEARCFDCEMTWPLTLPERASLAEWLGLIQRAPRKRRARGRRASRASKAKPAPGGAA
jgi:hypothetical protein